MQEGGEDVHYDLHVPLWHNYIANGAVHHNSGKTALAKTLAVCFALGADHPAVAAWIQLNRIPAGMIPNGPGRVWMVALTSNDSLRYHRKDIAALLPAGAAVKWYNRGGKGEARVEITVPGYEEKAEIWCKSCDQKREGMQGDSCRLIIFDEEPPEDVFEEAEVRLWDQSGRMILAMTPLKGLTWVYRRFVEVDEEGCRVHWLHSLDNPYLPKDRARKLKTKGAAQLAAARLYGKFTALEGLVWPEWDRGVHLVEPFDIPADWLRFRAMDFGARNPACVLWAAVDPESGDIFIYREHYTANWTLAKHAARIKEHEDPCGECEACKSSRACPHSETIESAWADPSGKQQIREMTREHDVTFKRAVNDWAVGRDAVAQALNPDASARVYVFSGRAPNFVREIERYRYPKERKSDANEVEKPIKKDDHAMDAFRYLMIGIIRYLASWG